MITEWGGGGVWRLGRIGIRVFFGIIREVFEGLMGHPIKCLVWCQPL